MIWRRATVALAAFGILVAVATPATAATTIPYTYVDNRIVVECRLDGQGPFAMILDTGSPSIAVTPETAGKLAVAVRAAGSVTGAGNSAAKSGRAKIATLSLGSLTFRHLDAEVLDLSEIRTKLHFARLDGIIGYPVLKHFATFVDADDKTITFARTAPAVPSDATATHFDGVLPEIHAVIDGVGGKVLVDTGDRSSLTLFGPFAKRNGFFGRYPSKKNIVTGYGLGGPVYADVFTLPSLDVFGTHLARVVTRASRQTGGAFASTAESASIGTGVLKRFNIVYDYPHDTIIAWPSKYFATPDAFVPPGS
jgi:Aspartyl protease